jgi:EKC/KEOPS complex subunit CGI121/TPRKB
LVVKVGVNSQTTKESVEKHLGEYIQGTAVSFHDETLSTICDVGRIKKAYKIPSLPVTKTKKGGAVSEGKGEEEEEEELSEAEKTRIERAILGAMALRGAT